jgi:hypothetical protein
MQDKFFKLAFKSNLLYIGERIKKGTFKPSISPIAIKYKQKHREEGILPLPYSTVTGSIQAVLGEDKNIHAIGKITKYKKGYMAVAPYDSALNTAKLPITIEYLTDVQGEIYIKETDEFNSPDLIGKEFHLGGLKSKGFGNCEVLSRNVFEPKRTNGEGRFLSRIYYDDNVLQQFGITKGNIIKPYFGYLFKKTSMFDGYYQKSIFENTIIRDGYDFLVEVIR